MQTSGNHNSGAMVLLYHKLSLNICERILLCVNFFYLYYSMRSNRSTLKSFTVILLLVFCQKVGGGLYLHNWLHANACKQSAHTPGNVVSGYNCCCIDDFSMPFADDAEKISQPIIPIKTEFIASYHSNIPFSSTFFHSLRAPPFVS
jgi:hypothetical protein